MDQLAKPSPNAITPLGRVSVFVLYQFGYRTIAAWAARRRSRHALARLDDQLLKDIGVDRLTRDREVLAPFWR
ncbi:DUF1127 domain-containing protein [Defluviimonas sp. WL0024]|uniref:DUF1127 domain-containing protein n=1 Tax=Albidovulum salinarum TaxID=2984153 RepID=A0ABT2X3Y5_9RHOB|nr:DUF1127 domain-containing protein [Defluviimonas sp. WL0024]MCU9848656.1 DUF1127 domain-containing protein [Defluviimonas sp. WL0024]